MADNQVAVIQPPRLPYHPAFQEKANISLGEWRVLCESVFPAAQTADSILLAVNYCRARRFDVFKKMVHIVPIWDNTRRRMVETVWPSIAEYRTTAMRTGNYAGLDAPRFGEMKTEKFSGKVKSGDGWKTEEIEVTYPEWCEITLFRLVQGQKVPFPGPRVYWREFFARRSRTAEIPNEQWAKRPNQMLEKCAEAGALRRAFPEELGEEWTLEEMGAAQGMGHNSKNVSVEIMGTTPPEPQLADFEEQQDAEQEAEKAKEVKVVEKTKPPVKDKGADTSTVTDVPPSEAEPEQSADDVVQPKTWDVKVNEPGEAPKLKAILELLPYAHTEADVDALVETHKDFLNKLGRAKADTKRAIYERRLTIQQGDKEDRD